MKYIVRYTSKIFLFLFVLHITCIVARPIYAQSPKIKPFISVYPVIFNISLRPGKTTRHEITVKNLLDTPLPLRSNLESFDLSDEDFGQKPPETLSSWAKVSTPDMIMQPHEEKKIVVTITLPREIPLGGYYSNLNLEPKLLLTDDEASTHIHPQIKILFLGSVGIPRISPKIGEIGSFELPFFNQKSTIPIDFNVKNVSLYHFSGKPMVKVVPLLGRMQEIELEEKIVLPGRSRLWEEQLSIEQARHLLYKVNVQVSVGAGHKIVETRYLLVLPYAVQIVVSLLSVLSILLILNRKKKIARALRILFSRN